MHQKVGGIFQADLCKNLDPIMNSIERVKPGGKEKRSDIQCLRGVAIIYVLLFHLFPTSFPKGFLGVDIFFVISGYLITMILSKSTPISISDTATFFAKRIRRIFPAYYIMIFTVILFGFFYLTPNDQELVHIDSMWALVFASNVHKFIQKKDYFAQVLNYDFLLHAWSLAVEIQFYCIAPLLAVIGHRLRIGGFILILIAILSLWLNIATTGELQFSSLPSRLWQFILGGLAFKFNRDCKGLPVPISRVLAVLSMLCISPVMLFLPGHDSACRFAVTVSSAIIIARLSAIDNDFVLRGRALLFIGNISYSVYLAHWPLITLFKYYGNTFSLDSSLCLVVAQLSFVIGYLSYVTIEKYFIRESLVKSITFLSIILLISTSSITLPSLLNRYSIAAGSPSIGNFTEDTSAEVQNETRFVRECFDFRHTDYRPSLVTEEMRLKAIEMNSNWFMKHYVKVENDLPDPLFKKYFTDRNLEIPAGYYFKGQGKAKIAVFGNSFAKLAMNAVKRAYEPWYGELRMIWQSGIPPFIGATYYDISRVPVQEAAVALIEEMQPDVTFVIHRPFDGMLLPTTANITDDPQLKMIQNTIDRLTLASKRIVLEYPLPIHPQTKPYTPILLQHLQTQNPSFQDIKLDYSEYWAMFEHIFKRLDTVKCSNCDRIYPHKMFCDYKVCRLFDPDNLYSFFDMGEHYNDYAMKCIWMIYRELAEEHFANGVFEG